MFSKDMIKMKQFLHFCIQKSNPVLNCSHNKRIISRRPQRQRISSSAVRPTMTNNQSTTTSSSGASVEQQKAKNGSALTTIAIEGNIGSGKTTFLRHLQHFNAETVRQIEAFAEPIDSWRDVRGYNLFQLMADDVQRWCFPFQSYVQLSMLQMHQKAPQRPHTTIKLMERTLYSARYCFVENLYRCQHLRPEEYTILDEWFQHLVRHEPGLGVDLIIYLRTDPEVAFERIKRRARTEEENLTLDYLKSLHDLHEEWLLGGTADKAAKGSAAVLPAPVITIDANQDLDAVKRVYDRHSVDILNGNAINQFRNVCKQY